MEKAVSLLGEGVSGPAIHMDGLRMFQWQVASVEGYLHLQSEAAVWHVAGKRSFLNLSSVDLKHKSATLGQVLRLYCLRRNGKHSRTQMMQCVQGCVFCRKVPVSVAKDAGIGLR